MHGDTGTTDRVDLPRAAAAVRELLIALGEDPDRAGLALTPQRAAQSYAELLDGVGTDPAASLTAFTEPATQGIVALSGIAFGSMCEHKLLPFSGTAHIGYLPGKQRLLAGWGDVVRLVTGYAHRPQLQERLTSQIADALAAALSPEGVVVIVRAQHQCLSLVGERQAGTRALTS
ncbi:MAG: GTP cyclohydrolase I, partial [Mycobacteriales bacterium]